MRKPAAVLGLCVVLGGSTTSHASVPNRCPGPGISGNDSLDKDPVIQLAILLDTSNSMDGLIDQARQQLWKIVNELQEAQRYGRPAELHVALYEYGNSRLSAQSGYVRRVLPFTSDLDRVSEELFALRTSGGDEYCGTVIQSALDELRWSASGADLKVIVVAGNEPFSQGPVDYRRSCSRALAKGIFVDTIHCGPRAEGEATGWKSGALLAHGAFMTIDQDKAVVHIEAPQDGEIARLGIELNKTYLPFGRDVARASSVSRRRTRTPRSGIWAAAPSARSRRRTGSTRTRAGTWWMRSARERPISRSSRRSSFQRRCRA